MRATDQKPHPTDNTSCCNPLPLALTRPWTGSYQGNMQVYICLSNVLQVVDNLLPCNAVLKVVTHCLRQHSHRSCIGCGCQCLKQTHGVWQVGEAVDCIQCLLRQSQNLQPVPQSAQSSCVHRSCSLQKKCIGCSILQSLNVWQGNLAFVIAKHAVSHKPGQLNPLPNICLL